MGTRFPVHLVKLLAEPLKQLERRLCHLMEHVVLRVLRGHFQSARCMIQHQRLKVGLGAPVHKAVLRKEKVVAYAAADV